MEYFKLLEPQFLQLANEEGEIIPNTPQHDYMD